MGTSSVSITLSYSQHLLQNNVCPNCGKALPRCSICLMTLNVASDPARDAYLRHTGPRGMHDLSYGRQYLTDFLEKTLSRRRSYFVRPVGTAATRPISWNGFLGTTQRILKVTGTDKSVGEKHTMFVQCRIATATALMRCRFASGGPCMIITE